jgi:putative copper resistance protein D
MRATALFGLLAVIGGWAFTRLVVTRTSGVAVEPFRASLTQLSQHLVMAGAALIATLAVPRAVMEALEQGHPGQPTGAMVVAVLQSGWGIALIVQAAGAALVFTAIRVGGASRASVRLTDAGVALLVITPAFLGHAAADADRAALSVIVHTLHVAAAGGWIGSLLVLTILAAVLRARSDAGALLASLIVAFHPLALVCAGSAFATGLATAWLRMGAPEGIANPAYSGLFVAKVVLVFVTGALGAGHAKLAKKRVAAVDPATITRSLLGESLLAVLVLLVTAALAGTAPIG